MADREVPFGELLTKIIIIFLKCFFVYRSHREKNVDGLETYFKNERKLYHS